MKSPGRRAVVAAIAGFALLAAACGSDGGSGAPDESASASGENASAVSGGAELPTIVVTTNVLGDVVEAIAGDQAEIVTIMPVGADPHDFQASAKEVERVVNADALIANGAGFEEGLADVIASARADGVPTFEAITAVDTIEFGEGGHSPDDDSPGDGDEHSDDDPGDAHADDQHGDDQHGDDQHADDQHADDQHANDELTDGGDHDHGHEGADPHFFTDPTRMASAVDGIVGFLIAEVAQLDAMALGSSAAAYLDELEALDVEVAELVGRVAVERRVLVTNHEVFGYFADRYGFEIVGVVVPGGGTTDSVSAGELAELAEVIESEGVPAIFADASSPDELVTVLADEVGDVAVVELYSESLGEPGSDGATYLAMVRSNAERISAALA